MPNTVLSKYSWNYKRKIIYNLIENLDWQYVLDIGCKNGEELLKYISKNNKTGIGLDINKIHNCPTENIQFLQGDGHHLPFRDETFDLITATEVIEHLPDGDQFLKECYRVLKNGGYLVLSTPNKLRFLYLVAIARRYNEDTESGHGLSFGHINEYTPMRIKRDLAKTNFKLLFFGYGAVSPYMFPPFVLSTKEYSIVNNIYLVLEALSNSRFIKPLFKGDMILVAQKI